MTYDCNKDLTWVHKEQYRSYFPLWSTYLLQVAADPKKALRFDEEDVETPAAKRPKLEPVVARGLHMAPVPVVGQQTVSRTDSISKQFCLHHWNCPVLGFQYGNYRRMVNPSTKIVHALYCLGQSYGKDQEGRQVVWAWWNPWTAPFEFPWIWSQRNWDPCCCATYLWPALCRETWIHGSLQLWSRTLVIIKGWLYNVLVNSPFWERKYSKQSKEDCKFWGTDAILFFSVDHIMF